MQEVNGAAVEKMWESEICNRLGFSKENREY